MLAKKPFRALTILAVLVLLAAGVIVTLTLPARASATPTVPNPNCALRVPADPLSATGLATPYRLSARNDDAGPCSETEPTQAAFVEAAVFDPATSTISIYHPLVVTGADDPAVPPVPVTLPTGAVVGIWFGYNGDTLTLTGPGSTGAVNGLHGSVFGQFAYINAPAFFAAAEAAITAGTLAVPPLGTAKDGLPCPTTRDWVVVDQDQSDNVATSYVTVNGQLAQDTADNRALGARLVNGSDERLLAKFIDPALGCTPWTAPDLTDGGAPVSALALNELSAAHNQAVPTALVPTSDPMTLIGGDRSPDKTNLYRAGVDQAALPAGPDPNQYCRTLARLGAPRITADIGLLATSFSPDPRLTLYGFLSDRYTSTLELLGCNKLHHHRHHDKDDGGKDR